MRSRTSTPVKNHLYRNFSGLNTRVSEVALENPESQPFVFVDNLICSPSGYLSNERPMSPLPGVHERVTHMRSYASRPGAVVFAADLAGHTELRVLDRNIEAVDIGKPEFVTSVIFNKKAIVCHGGNPSVLDNGAWSELAGTNAVGATLCAVVSNRLVLSGFSEDPTEVLVSRVNSENVMPDDEAPGDTSPLKAFRFNIGNLLGTSDAITGLASLEGNKLVIFTRERALVYLAPVEYEQWQLDQRVSINDGAISHNSICSFGDEILFCSSRGVHSLRRSVSNGVTLFTQPLSSDIEEAYKTFLSAASSHGAVSALFERRDGRYSVFFPSPGGVHAVRLTMLVNPRPTEGDPTQGLWSVSTSAAILCGLEDASSVLYGSAGGIFEIGNEHSAGERDGGEVVTPILWQGDFNEPKQTHAIVLFGSGKGTVIIDAEDEDGRQLQSTVFELTNLSNTNTLSIPLPVRFVHDFQHGYVGLRLRVKILKGSERVRIYALGVQLREP